MRAIGVASFYSHQLSRRGLTVTEFRERAIEENGLFALTDSGVDENGVEWEETRYFQDSKGLLPLSPVDTDARWRTSRPSKPPELNYQDNAIVDRGGFILSRGVTHASEGEWEALPHERGARPDVLPRRGAVPLSAAGWCGEGLPAPQKPGVGHSAAEPNRGRERRPRRDWDAPICSGLLGIEVPITPHGRGCASLQGQEHDVPVHCPARRGPIGTVLSDRVTRHDDPGSWGTATMRDNARHGMSRYAVPATQGRESGPETGTTSATAARPDGPRTGPQCAHTGQCPM